MNAACKFRDWSAPRLLTAKITSTPRNCYFISISRYAVLIFLLTIFTAEAVGQSANMADNTGVQPFQTYLHDKETINLATGGVNIHIPLLHLPGRAGHDLDFAINFNNQSRLQLGLGSSPVFCPISICASNTVAGVLQFYIGYSSPTNGWTTTMPSINFNNVTGPATYPSIGYVGGPSLTGDHGEQVTFGLQVTASNFNDKYLPVASAAADDQGQDVIASSPGDGSLSFYFPDGHRLVAPAAALYGGIAYTEFDDVDRNGNTITYNINSITDTLGRTVSFTYPFPTTGNSAEMGSSELLATSMQYVDSNGANNTIRFVYGESPSAPSATVDQPTFSPPSSASYCTDNYQDYSPTCVEWMGIGGPSTTSPTAPINISQTSLSAIILPNGLTYSFQYDAYGDLIKITYPDGGYTRYDYQKTLFGISEMFGSTLQIVSSDRMQVSAKYVCTAAATPPGTTVTPSGDTCPIEEEITTYTPAAANIYQIGNTTNKVVTPDGTTTSYTFFNAPAVPMTGPTGLGIQYSGYNPQPEISETTTSSSGQLLRAVSNVYEADGAHLKRRVTTLDNGNTITENWIYNVTPLTGTGFTIAQGVLASGYTANAVPCSGYCNWTQTSSAPNNTYATVWNVVSDSITDWNGTVMKTTADGWQTPTFNPANPYIPSQKVSETVYQGSSSMVLSQTQYVYDNYTTYPMIASGATQHNNVPGLNFSTSDTVRGNLTSIQRWRSSDNSWLTSYVQYDDAGSEILKVDPKGYTTTYSYADSWNNGTCAPSSGVADAYPTKVTNALGQSTLSTYNSCTGTLATLTDANSQTTTYSYDAYDRIIDILYPETYPGTSTHAETKTCYSDSGDCTGASASSNYVLASSAITPGLWRVDETDFDGIGRTISSKNLSDPYGMMEVDTSYNDMEQVYSVSNPYRPSEGSPSGSTTYYYDGLGRKTNETEPDSQQLSWSYAGTTTVNQDETGRRWTHSDDALNRLVEVLEPDSSGSDTVATQYTYDSLGNLLRADQWGGAVGTAGERVRTFTYDSLSQLITSNNPEAGLTCYGTLSGSTCTPAYDPDGNLQQQTDARGIVTTISYDQLNRVVGRSYSDGTPSACFQYDNAANDSSGLNRAGRLLAEWTQAGSCSSASSSSPAVPSTADNYRVVNSYAPGGQITSETQCPLAPCSTAYTFPYTYDLAGNILTSTGGDPAATTAPSFAFLRDASDRLSDVISSTSGYLFRADSTTAANIGVPYGPFGLTSSELAVNPSTNTAAIKDARGYDTRGRILTEFDTSLNGPGTIDGTQIPGTPSTGSIDLSFAEQQMTQATSGTGSTATVAVNGTDKAVTPCPSNTALAPDCLDYGVVFIDVNNTEGWVYYENGVSATALASSLSSSLNSVSSPLVTSSVNGNVLTLTSLAVGSQTNSYEVQAGSLSLTMEETSSTVESGPSFLLAATGTPLESGPTTGGQVAVVNMTGGTTTGSTTIYDSGTVTATAGNTTATVSWNQNSTAASIASELAAAIQASSGGTLTASASGGIINLQSVAAGTAQDVPVSVSITHNSADFPSESLGAYVSPGGMTGGTNPISNPSASGLVYGFEIPIGASGYSGNSDLLSVNDSVMGTWSYSYDQINRLTAASSAAGAFSGTAIAWGYDAFGNRLNETVTAGSTAPALPQSSWATYNTNNQVSGSSMAPAGYSYTLGGQIQADNLNQYYYDGDGRLCAEQNTLTGATTGYTYDAEGLRVSKGTLTAANCSNSNGFTANALYLVDLGGDQVTELDASRNWKHTNVFAGGRLLATYDTKGSHFQFTDILGTRRVQTDGSGNIEETCTSLPFGDGLNCVQTTVSTADDATEHHFTGKERDVESGLDYFEARYYSSTNGIFISPDWASSTVPIPYADINNPQSLNLYAYVQNNPVTHQDLTGHATGPATCGGQASLPCGSGSAPPKDEGSTAPGKTVTQVTEAQKEAQSRQAQEAAAQKQSQTTAPVSPPALTPAQRQQAAAAYAEKTTQTPEEARALASVIQNRINSGQSQYVHDGSVINPHDLQGVGGPNYNAYMQGHASAAGAQNATDGLRYVQTNGPTTSATFFIVRPHGAPPTPQMIRNLGHVVPGNPPRAGDVFLFAPAPGH